jgi:hypothetical protein
MNIHFDMYVTASLLVDKIYKDYVTYSHIYFMDIHFDIYVTTSLEKKHKKE